MFKKTLMAAALAAVSSSVLAETPKNEKIEEMVVIANRVEMPISRVGASVSVLTHEDIEAKGSPVLADALRFTPGIAVSNSGGIGRQTSIRVRGEESYRTLILIDGVDISDITSTQVSPRAGHLLSHQIDRVEVLRGPQGMMYGADAGGVVNVFTRRASEGEAFAGGFSTEAGRYGTKSFSGNVRGDLDKFDYSLTAVDYSTDGFNTRTHDQAFKDDDGYDNTTLTARFGYELTDKLYAQAFFRDVEAESMIDGWNAGASHDQVSKMDQSIANLQLTYSGEVFGHKLSYSKQDLEREDFTSGVSTYKTEGELTQVQYVGSVNFSAENSLVLGADYDEQEDIENGYELDQIGIFVEWQGQLGESFFYTLGMRNDDNEAFGAHDTYRVTAAYLQDYNFGTLKYKATYGTGFRAPSLFELNHPFYGNPDLVAEESEGFDVGVELTTADGHYFEFVYFDQDIIDAIEYDFGTSSYGQSKGKSNSKGIELLSELNLSDSLSLVTTYMYNDAYKPDDTRRNRRPRHVASLGLQGVFFDELLQVNLDVRGVQDREYEGEEREDYEVVNLRVAYQMTHDLKVFVRGENIFNEDYEETNTYNTSSAAFYAGFSYDF